MRNKLYVIILSVFFSLLLIWCPTMISLEKLGVLNFADNRNYKDPEKIYEDVPLADFLNKIEEGKAAIENVYTNYLPAYTQIVVGMRDTESSIQMNFVDMLLPKQNITTLNNNNEINEDVINNITDEEENIEPTEELPPPLPEFTAVYIGEETHRRFYAIRPYDFLESALKLDEANLYKNMKHQAEGINRVIKANTDVNFYLYICKTLQDEEIFRHIVPNELCTADMFNEFFDSIVGAAGKDYFKIDTIEKRLEKQFRTDHHWNSAGSYDAYCDIIRMMSANTPEIGEPVAILDVKRYPNIKMRGSYSALAGYSAFYEDFFVNVFDLPPAPRTGGMRSNEAGYDAGNFDNESNIYFDHYSNYYVNRRKYTYPNGTGRNLMIIGDSLAYWSAWLIAANFDRTYVYFPWDGQTIDYNKYIEENGITDVLMVVYSQAGVFNVYGYCRYEQFVTD